MLDSGKRHTQRSLQRMQRPLSGGLMSTEALARLAGERVDHRFKGLPPDADGLTVGELAAQRRNLFTDGFATPVLALSAERLEHNLKLMETYAARHGLA